MTRDHIRQWITGWKISQSNGGTATLREWIAGKIIDMSLDDDMVDTSGMDHVPKDEMHVAEYIMLDIRSYANAPSS